MEETSGGNSTATSGVPGGANKMFAAEPPDDGVAAIPGLTLKARLTTKHANPGIQSILASVRLLNFMSTSYLKIVLS
jgi:hypothetical protein